MDDTDALARQFADFADWPARHLPLYQYLCTHIADEPDVAARLLLAPDPAQRVPTLLLNAVHDLLLSGERNELAAWYGSITDPVRPIGDGENDPWPHFRRLAMDHPTVAQSLRTRSTQTNEVGRSCALLPALARLAAAAPGALEDGERPLGLVEIGASAGLNLLLDRYGYCYQPDRRRPAAPTAPVRPASIGSNRPSDGAGSRPSSCESAGAFSESQPVDEAWAIAEPADVLPGGQLEVNPSAFLRLECALRGTRQAPVPAEAPTIASRIGLDRHPVDLAQRSEARWLVACQWPDQPERVHRARTAVAMAHGDHPRVVQGDAVDDVAALVENVADFALPVVISTWVLAYLSPARQAEFLAVLDALGADRDLTLLFAEQPALVPALPIPPRPDGVEDERPTVLVSIDWRDGERTVTRLADMHPHGTWLEWLTD